MLYRKHAEFLAAARDDLVAKLIPGTEDDWGVWCNTIEDWVEIKFAKPSNRKPVYRNDGSAR